MAVHVWPESAEYLRRPPGSSEAPRPSSALSPHRADRTRELAPFMPTPTPARRTQKKTEVSQQNKSRNASATRIGGERSTTATVTTARHRQALEEVTKRPVLLLNSDSAPQLGAFPSRGVAKLSSSRPQTPAQ